LKTKLRNIYNSSKNYLKVTNISEPSTIIKSKDIKKVRRVPLTFGWLLEVPPMCSFFTTLLPQETPFL